MDNGTDTLTLVQFIAQPPVIIYLVGFFVMWLGIPIFTAIKAYDITQLDLGDAFLFFIISMMWPLVFIIVLISIFVWFPWIALIKFVGWHKRKEHVDGRD